MAATCGGRLLRVHGQTWKSLWKRLSTMRAQRVLQHWRVDRSSGLMHCFDYEGHQQLESCCRATTHHWMSTVSFHHDDDASASNSREGNMIGMMCSKRHMTVYRQQNSNTWKQDYAASLNRSWDGQRTSNPQGLSTDTIGP